MSLFFLSGDHFILFPLVIVVLKKVTDLPPELVCTVHVT